MSPWAHDSEAGGLGSAPQVLSSLDNRLLALMEPMRADQQRQMEAMRADQQRWATEQQRQAKEQLAELRHRGKVQEQLNSQMLTLVARMQARQDQFQLHMDQQRQMNMALFQHLIQHTGVPAFIPPVLQVPPAPLQTPLVSARQPAVGSFLASTKIVTIRGTLQVEVAQFLDEDVDLESIDSSDEDYRGLVPQPPPMSPCAHDAEAGGSGSAPQTPSSSGDRFFALVEAMRADQQRWAAKQQRQTEEVRAELTRQARVQEEHYSLVMSLFAGINAQLDQLELQLAHDRQMIMAQQQHLLQHTGMPPPAFTPVLQVPPAPFQTPHVPAAQSNGLPGQFGLYQQQFASLPQVQVQRLFTTPGAGLAHSEITHEPAPPFTLVPVSTPAASETVEFTFSSCVA